MSTVTIAALVTLNELNYRLIRRRNLRIPRGHTCLPVARGLSVVYGSDLSAVRYPTLETTTYDKIVIIPNITLGFRDERMDSCTTTVQRKEVEWQPFPNSITYCHSDSPSTHFLHCLPTVATVLAPPPGAISSALSYSYSSNIIVYVRTYVCIHPPSVSVVAVVTVVVLRFPAVLIPFTAVLE